MRHLRCGTSRLLRSNKISCFSRKGLSHLLFQAFDSAPFPEPPTEYSFIARKPPISHSVPSRMFPRNGFASAAFPSRNHKVSRISDPPRHRSTALRNDGRRGRKGSFSGREHRGCSLPERFSLVRFLQRDKKSTHKYILSEERGKRKKAADCQYFYSFRCTLEKVYFVWRSSRSAGAAFLIVSPFDSPTWRECHSRKSIVKSIELFVVF